MLNKIMAGEKENLVVGLDGEWLPGTTNTVSVLQLAFAQDTLVLHLACLEGGGLREILDKEGRFCQGLRAVLQQRSVDSNQHQQDLAVRVRTIV